MGRAVESAGTADEAEARTALCRFQLLHVPIEVVAALGQLTFPI